MVRFNSRGEPDKIFSISEITQQIKGLLESAFPRIWVEGEVSNFHRHHSGHFYLTLKDQASSLRAVMFRSDAAKVAFDMEDGLQIVCRGRINVYQPRGEYQFLIESVQPKGKGSLQLAFEQLKAKLAREGLFDPDKKKKLPLFPKKVGLVTSPRGAAIIDILRTLGRRFANVHVLIYPVRVQGEGAAEEIVSGIDYLGALPGMDVLIVGRGGGSIEDLWAFNEEKVARAIFRCPVPLISAVGHEVDFTISDFVADIRASTPSAAGEMVLEKEEAFRQRIENYEKRLVHHQRFFLQEKKHLVSGLIHNEAFQNFKIRMLNTAQRVDELETKARDRIKEIRRTVAEALSQTRLLEEKVSAVFQSGLQLRLGKWEKTAAALNGLSPLNILKKGYTVCWDRDQNLIRVIDKVRPQDEVKVSFFRGEMTCLVRSVDREKSVEDRTSKKADPRDRSKGRR
jgi:exodeoxyribonuclease VII large subunit